jgi:hypothetical protein
VTENSFSQDFPFAFVAKGMKLLLVHVASFRQTGLADNCHYYNKTAIHCSHRYTFSFRPGKAGKLIPTKRGNAFVSILVRKEGCQTSFLQPFV